MSLLVAKDPTTELAAIDMPHIAWYRVSSAGSFEFPTELPDRILSHALAIANGSFTIVSTFYTLVSDIGVSTIISVLASLALT